MSRVALTMTVRGHNDTRVNLYPLAVEEVVRRLVRVPPPPKDQHHSANEQPPKPEC